MESKQVTGKPKLPVNPDWPKKKFWKPKMTTSKIQRQTIFLMKIYYKENINNPGNQIIFSLLPDKN